MSVVVEVFNAESPRVLQPQYATHAMLEGRQHADTHTTTGLAAGSGVAFELTCMHATTQLESFAHKVLITAAVDTMLTHSFFLYLPVTKNGVAKRRAERRIMLRAIVMKFNARNRIAGFAECDVDQMALHA